MKPNKLTLLAAAVILLLGWPALATDGSFYQEQPDATSAITFDNRGFIINGQRTFVASGDIHYPRVPQALWHDRLLRLKRSGLNTVQTYAFPNYHSTGQNVYDFTGEKDFNLYLQDIHSLGLYATVRAGIYVCSEWDNGGYPEWLLLEPGVSIRTYDTNFLAASDAWYGQVMPIISTNQINRNGSVIMVQLDNENSSCWGVDTKNQPYFTHLRTNALANGLEVPMFFSGMNHSHAPLTSPIDSVGRISPWYTTEFWAGWYNLYGGTLSEADTYDRNTWLIIACGGNGYNYYMFHGGSNFDHWPSAGIGASYDYGAALGQAGDFRTLYYRDKRAAWFARSLQAVLEDSTNATAAYAGAASGVTSIYARGSPAGTILFLDNNTSANAIAVLTNGAQITLEPGDIAPVVKNFALTSWLTIQEADARIFGIQPQGDFTTLVLYGLPGDTVRVGFTLTGGSLTYADPAFAANAITPASLTFSALISSNAPAAYELVAGTNTLRVLVMSKTAVDRTWFVDSAGTNYVVSGPAYVGEFTNVNNQIACSLEEPVGNSLPTNLLVFDGTQFAPRTLAITNQISTSTLTAPTLQNWQMRWFTNQSGVCYDDSTWFTTNTPPLMGMDGDDSNYAWYRAGVTVTNAGAYILNFTGINDWGTLFVNGQQVSMTSSSAAFSTPLTLQAGSNTLAIFTSQTGRDSLYNVYGTSATAFTPRGLLGPVTLTTDASFGVSLTSWYWLNVGSSAPSSASVATVTATNFSPATNGWNTGAGWNADVFSGTPGYAWFQTVLPAVTAVSHSIHFTNVDDNCTVYLNGTNIVGTHNGWGQPFDVSLDACWQTNSPNVLTILVQNTGGGGGLNGTVILNSFNLAAPIPTWKLQGGVGTIEGTNVTWQPLVSANGLPAYYRATFQYQQPAGVQPILRAGWSGLSRGFIWLNGHNLGRYPDVIPVSGIYLPECWLGATNELIVFDEQGNSPASETITVETTASRQLLQCTAPVSAPTNVLAPASLNATPGNAQILLTWAPSAGATNYYIWRGLSSGKETNAIGTSIGTSYTDTGLTNDKTYYYVVTAAAPAGISSNSQEASATPVAPTGTLPPASLSIYPDNGQITLLWSASAGATNYTIWRGLSSGNETNAVGISTGTTYTDIGLANGTTYYYVVTAAGPLGASDNSPEASATPLMTANVLAPVSLIAYPGNLQITLAWAASSGATSYVVWRSVMSGNETTAVATNTSTTYTDTGLVNGTTYYYVVTAAGTGNVSGNSPEASATPSTAVSGTWMADANGNWGNANNWFGGNIADGDGNTADFSTVNLTANRTITLDAPHTISVLNFGDTVPDYNWTLAGTNALTLGMAPVIDVVNQTATISTVLAGTAFTKTGAGTLALNGATANPLTGTLAINAGALTEDFSNLTTSTNLITNGVTLSLAGGTLNVLGAAGKTASQTFSGTALNAGPNVFNVINNGTFAALALKALAVTMGATANFSATGTVTTTTAGGDALGVLGVRGNVNSPVGYATVGTSDWATTDTSAGGAGSSPYVVTGLGNVDGGYLATMGGTGQNENLDLQASYTAGANVGASTIRFNTPSATTVNVNGKWVVIGGVLVTPNMGANNCSIGDGNWFPYYSTSAAADEVVWQNNTAGFFTIGSLINNRGNLAAPVTYIQAGPGTVVMPGTSTVTGAAGNSANAYTGQSYLDCGFTVVKVDADLGASAAAAQVNLNGGTVVGNATFAMDNGGGLNPRPFNLAGNGGGLAATAGNTMTIDGVISSDDSGGPLTIGIPALSANNNTAGLVPGSGSGAANAAMNATGTVVLSGADTYTGDTVVISGTLQLGPGGSINNSPDIIVGGGTTFDVSPIGGYTLDAGQNLLGGGTINGSIMIPSGGVLWPGNLFGTLAFSNNLTLSAGSLTTVLVQHAPATNNAVNVAGTLNEGGTLNVTMANATAFAAGDNFKLFTAGNYSGAFASFILPPLPANLAWNTARLNMDGTIWVVSTIPPSITRTWLAGSSLIAGGVSGTPNWNYHVLMTTNLALPLVQWSGAATNVFDPDGNFTFTNPISADRPRLFFRIQAQ